MHGVRLDALFEGIFEGILTPTSPSEKGKAAADQAPMVDRKVSFLFFQEAS